MAVAAALVSGSLVASRLLGLVRVSVFADLFGTSQRLADYTAAFRIPDILFTIVAGGALTSAFVPVFAGLLEEKRESDAWRVANTTLNSMFIALIVLASLAFVFAPQLTRILYPGSGINPTETASLTRIMLVQPVLLGVGGLFAAMQNSYNRFLLPAVAPVLYNGIIILGAVVFAPRFGVYAAAWAVVVGAVIMFEVQIWGVSGEAWMYRLSLNWHLPETRQVVKLMGPRLLGLSAFQMMLIVTYYLASGSHLALNSVNYAWTLVMFPVGAVGTAIGMAVFPTLSRQSAGAQMQSIETTVRDGLRAITFLAMPATAGLILLRRPIITLLYAHGAFGPNSTAATALALGFYALCVVPLATMEVAARAFYALKNTRTPVIIAVVAAALDSVLCILLWPSGLRHGAFGGVPLPSLGIFSNGQGQGGLGLATAISVWVQLALLISALRNRLPNVIDVAFRRGLTAIVVATLGMSLCVYVVLEVLDGIGLSGFLLGAFVEAVAGIGAGIVVYLLIARALHLSEVARFAGFAGRFGPRRRGTKGPGRWG